MMTVNLIINSTTSISINSVINTCPHSYLFLSVCLFISISLSFLSLYTSLLPTTPSFPKFHFCLLPLFFNPSVAPALPRSSLLHRSPLLHCMGVSPGLSLWVEEWVWPVPLVYEGAGLEAGNALAVQDEMAQSSLILTRHLGIGCHWGHSASAVALIG